MRDNTNLIIVYILSCFISTSREVYNKLMYADVLKQLNYVFAAPVTDRLLMTVAQKLGANSMELGVMLGFQHVDVERMRCDERDALSLNFAILTSWRNRCPHQGSPGAMRAELRQALIDIGRTDIAQVV